MVNETQKQKYAQLRGVTDPDMALELSVAGTGSTVYIAYNGVELPLPFDTAADDLWGELNTLRATYRKQEN